MNRLAASSSPYLLQHAGNPVDWYPWGDEAFERARTTGRPLLVSVGYSSCHWCHVMEHESFSDQATATLMNELFVNVKVDREERPDIDALTMEACVTMTGQGGWPTTVFLTPGGRPFYAGHVLPPGPASRAAQLSAGLAGDRRCVGRPARRSRGAGRAARVRARGRNPARGGRGASFIVAPRGGRAWPRPRLRAGLRRLRHRAEVPARLRDRAPPAPRRRRGARDGATDARRDGRRRPVRRRRRRLPPLLRRRALGRSALREDALRQRAVDLRVPPCVGRDRRGPAIARSWRRRSATWCARCCSRTAASPRRRTPTRTASRG